MLIPFSPKHLLTCRLALYYFRTLDYLGDIVLPGLLLAWAARLDIRSYGSLSSPYASKGMADSLIPSSLLY